MLQKRLQDKKKRKMYKKNEFLQCALLTLLRLKDSTQIKLLVHKELSLGENLSYRTKIKNYCLLTGRSRSIYRQFKISRLLLRQLGASGYLFGVKKNSW